MIRPRTLPRGLLLEILNLTEQGRAPQPVNAGIADHPEHGRCVVVGIGYPWHKGIFGGPVTHWVPVAGLHARLGLHEREEITGATVVKAIVGAGGLVGATALRLTIHRPDDLGEPSAEKPEGEESAEE